jgi:hypothetical protein
MKKIIKKTAAILCIAFAFVAVISIFSGDCTGSLVGGAAAMASAGLFTTDEVVSNLLGLQGESAFDGEDSFDEKVLGALQQKGKITQEQRKIMARHANAKVQARLKESILSPGQRFLIAESGRLDRQSQLDIAARKSRFELMDIYFRRELTGSGGIFEVNKPNDNMIVGIQNIQSNKLEPGQNMALESIKLAYGYSADGGGQITTPAGILYTNALDAETAGTAPLAIPAALLNGEIEVRIEGNKVVRLPIKKFFRESFSVGVGTEGMTDVVKFNTPILWKENTPILCQIHYAQGLNLPTGGKHFLEVRLMGAATVPRG